MNNFLVGLTTEASADELFEQYMHMSAVQCQADAFVADLREIREVTTSEQETKALDQTLERAWQEYQVLSAYVQVVYSAYIFQLHGTESVFITEFGVQAGDRSKFAL